MLAYVVVSSDLELVVGANWRVRFMAIEYDQAGVFDLVMEESGPRLKPDADV